MTDNHRNTAETVGEYLAKHSFEDFFPDLAKDHDFGVWRYHADNHILTYGAGRSYYEIDLEMVGSSAGMLDWIFHIAEKSWATPAVVRDLVLAFYEIFGRIYLHNRPQRRPT